MHAISIGGRQCQWRLTAMVPPGTTPGYRLNLQSIYDLKLALAEMPAEALGIETCVAA